MLIRVIAMTLVTMLAGLLMPMAAHAAAQIVIWPAQFSYGTPSGTFTWNSTAIGLRLDQAIAPFSAVGTSFYYGSISNLTFAGGSLSGYSGQTLAGDLSLRLGMSAGPLGLTGYAGYGGSVLNASGPAASDRIVLTTLGFRVGAEAKIPLTSGLALRGSWTALTGLNSQANFSLSTPPTAASQSGTGSGSEYEVAVLFSPISQTSILAGYRAGTYQTAWSGSGTTTTRYDGFFVGLEIRF